MDISVKGGCPLGSTEGFLVKPIGVIRTSYSREEIRALWQEGVTGYIEIYPEYKPGLKGLEGFSHIIVIVWLHERGEKGREVLQVKHRKLARMGVDEDLLPLVGVFATDSPDRPNLLGLSVLEVEKIKDNRIYVRDLDYYDGTPVLDIKPLTPDRIPESIRVPSWYEKLVELVYSKTGSKRI